MIGKVQARHFGHHALAVLAAVMITSTLFSIIWAISVVVTTAGHLPLLTWLATMAVLVWFGVFIVALPSSGLILSMLWPVTRRGTLAADGICILAGGTMGIIVAPLASPKLHGTTLPQLALFAVTGIAVAAFYLKLLSTLTRDAPLSRHVAYEDGAASPATLEDGETSASAS